MLTSLQLTNFKSFEEQTLRFAPFTLFVGANAAGKSNVFDALRFLQGLRSGMPLAEIFRGRWEGGREVWPGIRGGAGEVARVPGSFFSITSRWEVLGRRVTHAIQCAPVPATQLRAELLEVDGVRLFDTHGPAVELERRGVVESDRIAVDVGIGAASRCESFSAQRSLLGQIQESFSAREILLEQVQGTEERLAANAALGTLMFLNMTPSRMRDPVPRLMPELGAEGENLSAIVWQLVRKEDRRGLVEWLAELCAPELLDIDFIDISELGDVMLRLVEKGGTRVSARGLSDGTLRFLGNLVALKTAPAHSVILMEEIENGLHPQRIHLLIQFMESVAKERAVQIIATTHSPTVLATTSRETLKNTILFARPPGSGSVARRLGDLPDFEAVVEKRGIEHLFTTGWLERAL